MDQYAKPGEGLLGMRTHQKLESFLMGQHSVISILVALIAYSLLVWVDDDFRSLTLKLAVPQSVMDLIVFGAIIIPVVFGVFILFQLFFNKAKARSTIIISAVGLGIVYTLVGIEYFLHSFLQASSIGSQSLSVALGFYYLSINLIFLQILMRQPKYLLNRIMSLNHGVWRLGLGVLLIFGVVYIFYIFKAVETASWAYVFTVIMLLWSIIESLFKMILQ